MNTLRFVTWNVRGIGSPRKRLKILEHLNNLQADIVLLQETHTSKVGHNKLSSSHFPHTYVASYNSKQRGVAILIGKKVHFTCNSTISDSEGRFIIINISTQNTELCIANIYGPNVDDPSFFHSFFTALSAYSDTTLIVGGDFNLVLNPEIDRLSRAGSYRNWQSADIIKQYMSDFGLCDAWRSCHPMLKEYTFFSPVHHSYSRLDYFLTSNSTMMEISDTQIHPITISDHAPVTLTITKKTAAPPSRQWKFNTSLLKDPDFIKFFERVDNILRNKRPT